MRRRSRSSLPPGNTWISAAPSRFVPFPPDECYDAAVLVGYNHNLRHEGVLFHVQTEDGGVESPFVVTHVFAGGNILASRRASYAKFTSKAGVKEIVLAMMQEQHKEMMKDLVHGRLPSVQKFLNRPLASSERPEPGAPPPLRHPAPPPPRKPSVAPVPASRTLDTAGATEMTLDELILNFLEADKEPPS